MFSSIPASCRFVALEVNALGNHGASTLRRLMPAAVRAVSVRGTAALRQHGIRVLIDRPAPPFGGAERRAQVPTIGPTALLALAGAARFDVLELETIDDVTLAKLLAASPAMSVRLDVATGAQLADPRVALGRPGDAALISPQYGRAIAVRAGTSPISRSATVRSRSAPSSRARCPSRTCCAGRRCSGSPISMAPAC